MEEQILIKIVIDKCDHAHFGLAIETRQLQQYINGHTKPEEIKRELLDLINDLKIHVICTDINSNNNLTA